MPPVGFEPTISADERPQTYAFRPRGHWDRRVNKQANKQASKDSHCQAPIKRNKRIFRSEMSTFTNKKHTHNVEDNKYVI